ncbi:MAG: putative DNA-binding domain-containing protein [Deltaproteobacteria bacterium]|nr:putative DNA-binding domain-containing protein [Deltaproteobacteria bacterium]
MPLPADWRARWVGLVTGQGGDAGFLAGGPILDGVAGLAVYQEAWRLRHADALRVEVPGLAALLGDRLDALAARYFADHPSRSWTLDRIADRFADWLAARGEPAEVVEMARLDHRVMRSFTAGDLPPVRPEDLAAGLPDLALQPHAAILRLTTDVHRFRTAVLAGTARPEVKAASVWLAIWRVDRVVQTMPLDPAAGAILAGIEAGLGIEGALEAAFAEGLLTADTLAVSITGTFRLATERGLVGLRT